MKAYHIRTVEQSTKTPIGWLTGLETLDLDSICVPDKRLVLGLGNDKDKRSNGGAILDHSYNCDRALSIIKQDDPEIKGEVIGEFDLSQEVYNKIETNRRYHETFVSGCQVFDGSTNSLVAILSGPIIVLNKGEVTHGDRVTF